MPVEIDPPTWLCPKQCGYTSHIRGVDFGDGCVPASTSGMGLVVYLECECGNSWRLVVEDHSGCLTVRTEDHEPLTGPGQCRVFLMSKGFFSPAPEDPEF